MFAHARQSLHCGIACRQQQEYGKQQCLQVCLRAGAHCSDQAMVPGTGLEGSGLLPGELTPGTNS